jgi:hypothetical protein
VDRSINELTLKVTHYKVKFFSSHPLIVDKTGAIAVDARVVFRVQK